MVRALVLICSSTALGMWLARLLLGRGLPQVDSSRLGRIAGACLLGAICFQLVQVHGHGMVLLAGTGETSLTEALLASTRTYIGAVLWAQAALLGLAGLLEVLSAGWPVAASMVASLVCAALSAHVAAGGDSAAMSAIALVHVVLVGLWFGGLPALWLLWKHRNPGGMGAEPLDVQALRSFSRFALPAMLMILASGLLLATQTVGRWAALVATLYGWLLLTKLVLVAAVLACALMLRRALRRKSEPGTRFVARMNGRWLGVEGVLGCGVVAAAGILATWVPAAHQSFEWPFGFRFAPQAAWLQQQEQIKWPLAAVAVLVVLGLGLTAAAWRRHRRVALVAGCGSMACGLAIAIPALTVAAFPSSYSRSSAPYDVSSVAAGGRLYRALCAQCHGERGQGDGPLARSLNPAPADLTAPHLGWHLHGDMYWWITHGFAGSAMPPFESRTTDLERWQIVNYLMALSLGYQARSLGERPLPDSPWLASIDFRYPRGNGDYVQLSELQLTSTILLVLIRDAAELSRVSELAAQTRELTGTDLKFIVVLGQGLGWSAVDQPAMDVVSDERGEIYAAWSHYRRTLAQPDFRDELPEPARMELLVDRYGYVRARWRADEGVRKPTVQALKSALDTFAREPEFSLADAHAH